MEKISEVKDLVKISKDENILDPGIPILPVEPHLPHYYELLALDDSDEIKNTEIFACPICLEDIEPGKGIILRECLHNFCQDCLCDLLRNNTECEVVCPYSDNEYSCKEILQQREIKSLLSEKEFETFLAMILRVSEQRINKNYRFHCQTPDCAGWCLVDSNVSEMICPICNAVNCIRCEGIHPIIDCNTFRDLRDATNSKDGSNGYHTYNTLYSILKNESSMRCPECGILINRVEGCDGVICTACKTDICWIRKMKRWGPAGKGDTTGGCKCNINNIKCHPDCRNCH